ncbi:MAG: hypothetical protein H0T87_11710, partial [Gammaproteobacteria bacterium]|nr:hypothetical protein [Gammaproteobacteria bacterium]
MPAAAAREKAARALRSFERWRCGRCRIGGSEFVTYRRGENRLSPAQSRFGPGRYHAVSQQIPIVIAGKQAPNDEIGPGFAQLPLHAAKLLIGPVALNAGVHHHHVAQSFFFECIFKLASEGEL